MLSNKQLESLAKFNAWLDDVIEWDENGKRVLHPTPNIPLLPLFEDNDQCTRTTSSLFVQHGDSAHQL